MIFLVLAVHPLVFGRTPLGMVPAVLLGVVETLLVTNLSVLLPDGAPVPNLPWLVVIFGYGCVMTLILILVQDKIIGALLGAQWRSAPTDEAPSSQIPPTPPVRPSPGRRPDPPRLSRVRTASAVGSGGSGRPAGAASRRWTDCHGMCAARPTRSRVRYPPVDTFTPTEPGEPV
ncbi:hypothetical protein ACWDT5_06290 [Rhodococcus aetherivorans]